MRHKKLKIVFLVLLISGICAGAIFKIINSDSGDEITKVINPRIGSIQTFISTTGTVLPKNRLEVKPQVNGRIDSIVVTEGQNVKIGQPLAWMSSTERAALLDAAQNQGEEQVKYWKDVYKSIEVLSPINGEVIVATIQPGQTVTTSDNVVVLSDRLIVRAQVDETDIGNIKVGQQAFITLDAYSKIKVDAKVDHIYYESQTINNVTIYNVDLLPDEIPPFFRSGMNATVDFKSQAKENALLVPVIAVHKGKDGSFVLVQQKEGEKLVKHVVELGLTDDRNVEVISGLDLKDKIVIKTKRYSFPGHNIGKNPFAPTDHKRN